jgi:hypothetical protein
MRSAVVPPKLSSQSVPSAPLPTLLEIPPSDAWNIGPSYNEFHIGYLRNIDLFVGANMKSPISALTDTQANNYDTRKLQDHLKIMGIQTSVTHLRNQKVYLSAEPRPSTPVLILTLNLHKTLSSDPLPLPPAKPSDENEHALKEYLHRQIKAAKSQAQTLSDHNKKSKRSH